MLFLIRLIVVWNLFIKNRPGQIMPFKTADILDNHKAQCVAPLFKSYGSQPKMAGHIKTIKCFEDNSLIKEALDEDGTGKILVVDAGGSLRCAMLGDQLANKAVKNNWNGILMYGLIRDSVEISQMNLGVWALGTLPLKSIKLGLGQHNISVSFGGVTFNPGEFLYADEDGIIITKDKIQCNQIL